MPVIIPRKLTIRDFRGEDIPRLNEIDQICFRAGVAYTRAELVFYLKHPKAVCKVAELQGEIVGFVIGRVENDTAAHVITLDVIPRVRRRRIGTVLMHKLHSEFRKKKISLVILEVDAMNIGAQEFYKRLDYEIIETLRGYYNGCSDAYRMVRFMETLIIGDG